MLVLTSGFQAEIKGHLLHRTRLKLRFLFQQRLADQVESLKKKVKKLYLKKKLIFLFRCKITMCTLWIMASVQWVGRSSAALCRTCLKMCTIMSQLRRRTMCEKSGQKAGGTGGGRAKHKHDVSTAETQGSAGVNDQSPLSLPSLAFLFFWDSSA